MAEPQGPRRDGPASSAGPLPLEEVAERAARLGITVERVLEEYARLGFARVTDIIEWDEKGMRVKPSLDLTDDQVAAIAEIVATAKDRQIYRVKMHDKNAPLGALGRAIGVFPQRKTGANDTEQANDGEDPREFIIRAVDRIAAEEAQGSGDPGTAG